MNRLRKSKTFKGFMVLTGLTFLFQIISPTAAFALTGGPSQPEVQSFEPVGTNQMVDLFSGDFNYNIPLLDIEGYPINLAYHSGISMDQEASWVGLGWNINPGAITRGMRGLPDDFSGDDITTVTNYKPNKTWGEQIGGTVELFGYSTSNSGGGTLDLSFGIFYNNYKGVGYERGMSFTLASDNDKLVNGGLTLGLNHNSQQGIDISANANVGVKISGQSSNLALSSGVGISTNSRQGFKGLNVNAGFKVSLNGGLGRAVVVPFLNGSGSVPILSPSTTYTPSFRNEFSSQHLAYNIKIGASSNPPTTGVFFGGYYSQQTLASNIETRNSYGYLYAHVPKGNPNALHDLNRENEREYTRNLNYLPVTNYTYDLFNVAGQGVGGQYRTHRGEVAAVYDPYVESHSDNNSIGIEASPGGAGEAGKLGGNYTVVNTVSTSGIWNPVGQGLAFHPNHENYEASYFKMAGDKAAIDENFFNAYAGTDPISVKFTQPDSHTDAVATGHFKKPSGSGTYAAHSIPNTNSRTKRDKRNQPMTWLTAQEAAVFGLNKKIKSYQSDYWTNGALDTDIDKYLRDDNHREDHHISQINVTQPDGSRYVYGLPAYNIEQKDITFNASEDADSDPLSIDHSKGLVQYANTQDVDDFASFQNKGVDDFYQKTVTPAYVHSWLISGVLSQDYVDRTGDGITDDDFGTAVKFNYTKLSNTYNWRVPVKQDWAAHNEGFKSLDLDDKGHVSYGEKEVWYTHSIESKNYVAEFILSDRDDAHGVIDENGGIQSSTPLKRLEKIVLYSKHDRIANGANATPIKTVHFVYSYALCEGVLNSNSSKGKLTLTSVYFTYGNSNKGKLNAYEFQYRDATGTVENPDYNLKAYDRWGTYQENSNADGTYAAEFPYTPQNDQTTADNNASAWHLDKITLPSGSFIDITYQSDDYAYVQRQKAMEMFKVLGFGFSPNATPTTSMYYKTGQAYFNNSYLFFDLHGATTTADFIEDYLGNDDEIYFRMLVDLTGNGDKEYVSGFAKIDRSDCGVRTNTDEGYIKLKEARLRDDDSGPEINPIAKAAWNFNRIHLPQLIFPGSDPNGTGSSSVFALLGYYTEVLSMIIGHNRLLRRRGFGQTITPNQSWIRLYNPEGKKYGGGVRVKKITINDNWDQMGGTTGEDFYYGQEYFYTLEDGVTSSGVASYEPLVGGEENPLRRARAFSDDRKLAPDIDYYVTEPFGESFFPGASVGYSRVEVRNLQYGNVTRTATGKTINTFYTAYDFPVITESTELDAFPAKPKWINQLMKIDVKDHMTTSQGYLIINNDMHGKQRGVEVIDENGNQISKVEYNYKTKTNSPNRLSNEVTTITPEGHKETAQIGVEMDVVLDGRETTQVTNVTQWMIDTDVLLIAGIPIPIPMFWMPPIAEDVAYRSMVTTKVISQYGILEEVVATDLGATVTTKNLAWDSETGNVLLTQVENEYNDPVYNFTYPAHWAYDGMGQAYKNLRVHLKEQSTTNWTTTEKLAVNDPSEHFTEGDEIILREKNSSKEFVNAYSLAKRLWVVDVTDLNGTGSDNITLMDRNGDIFTTTNPYVDITVIRSGRRNMQSLGMGSVTSLTNPLDNYFNPLTNNTINDVIAASAIEFNEDWPTFCSVLDGSACDLDNGEYMNPYIWGQKGNWRANRSYAFLGERDQTDNSGQTKMREDGPYTTFTDFWNHPTTTNFWESDHQNWTWTSEVTKVDPYGNELENRNALGVYSAALFGYNNATPVMVAQNAEYGEILTDNFEDYDFWPDATNACALEDHWNFDGVTYSERCTTEAHTGISSLKVNAGRSASKARTYSECSPSTYYGVYDTTEPECAACKNVMAVVQQGIAMGLSSEALYAHVAQVLGISIPAVEMQMLAQNCIDQATGAPTDDEICVEECPCIGVSPNAGYYIVSAWVKEENVLHNYNNTAIEVNVNNGNTSTTLLQPTGEIIDGWQRIFGKVYVGNNTTSITFKLYAGTNATYFDDFRFLPADGAAMTYVYHPVNLRLLGQLDDNNYATFYEYDEEGSLIRTKRETARGVYTIQEAQGSLIK